MPLWYDMSAENSNFATTSWGGRQRIQPRYMCQSSSSYAHTDHQRPTRLHIFIMITFSRAHAASRYIRPTWQKSRKRGVHNAHKNHKPSSVCKGWVQGYLSRFVDYFLLMMKNCVPLKMDYTKFLKADQPAAAAVPRPAPTRAGRKPAKGR